MPRQQAPWAVFCRTWVAPQRLVMVVGQHNTFVAAGVWVTPLWVFMWLLWWRIGGQVSSSMFGDGLFMPARQDHHQMDLHCSNMRHAQVGVQQRVWAGPDSIPAGLDHHQMAQTASYVEGQTCVRLVRCLQGKIIIRWTCLAATSARMVG